MKESSDMEDYIATTKGFERIGKAAIGLKVNYNLDRGLVDDASLR